MDRLETFNQHRPLMFAIAYRMLSSVTETEDMLQEAWIKWQQTEAVVRSPKAFLSAIITRLCIDRLRSARIRRERYVGIWLPEPLAAENYQDTAELSESLSFAFLILLDCLSPTERAIFLLREVFDYSYKEISLIVGKSESNCRQMLSRSRRRIQKHKPSALLSQSVRNQEEIISTFLTTWNAGDVRSLVSLMSDDVAFLSDGGGQVTAARHPITNTQKVARFLVAIRNSRLIPAIQPHLYELNGLSGILNFTAKGLQSAFSFELSCKRIQTIFAIVNPEKLRSIQTEASSPISKSHAVKVIQVPDS